MRAAPAQPRLSAALLGRYNLSAQPFGPPQTCASIYRNTALDMLANTILQQLESGERLHIIKGERQIGKSTFCQRLECDAPEGLGLIRYTATRRSRINDVLAALVDPATAREAPDTHALATAAAQVVFRGLRNNRQPVLLIDDAHLLSTAVLRMVLRFHHSIEKQGLGQLKLVLLTEKQIDRKLAELDNAAPDDARLQTHLLRPLNRAEIEDYVRFRFEQAGGRESPLSAKQLEYLQKNAGGLPGKVDALTVRLLSDGGLSSPRRPALLAGAAGAAVLAAIIGAVMLWGGDTPPAKPAPEQAEEHSIPAAEPPEPAPRTETPEVTVPTEPPPPVKTGEAPAVAEADETPDAAPPETADGKRNTTRDAGEQTPTGDGASETGTSRSPEPATPAPDARPIDRWPSDHYAVQLAGAWTPERLEALAAEHQAEHDLLVHRVDRNTRSWYILLYGAFPDRAAAEAAVERLPPPLRDNRPWVRPIRGLLNP